MDIIISKEIRNSVVDILKKLYSRMKNDPSTTFCDIYNEVQKVIVLQKVYARKPVDRGKHMAGLLEWATRNEVNCSHINIKNYGEFGYGLEAAKDILMGTEFLEIPGKLFFDKDQFPKSKLDLCAPGMHLTFALLSEMGKPESFWSPYFNTLPSEYNMVLYFTPEDMELLSETSIQYSAIKFYEDALNWYIVNCIQLYELLEEDESKWTTLKNFCFEDFRWAYCTALTRHNTKHGMNWWDSSFFVPLLDLGNHALGQVATTFKGDRKSILSKAIIDFKKGDQIFMNYGESTLQKVFLENGYIQPGAPTNAVPIKFDLDNSQPDFEQKSQLLNHLKLPNPYFVNIGNILKPQCLAYLRVFCMPKDLLAELTKNQKVVDLLGRRFLWLSIEHEMNIYDMLYGKCQQAKKEFKCSHEMDMRKVEESKTSITKGIYKLRVEEKDILDNFLIFCQNHLAFLQQNKKTFENAIKESHVTSLLFNIPHPFICVNKEYCRKNKETFDTLYACHHLNFEEYLPVEERTITMTQPMPLVTSEVLVSLTEEQMKRLFEEGSSEEEESDSEE